MRANYTTDRIDLRSILIGLGLLLFSLNQANAQDCSNLQVLGSGYFCNEVNNEVVIDDTHYFVNITVNGTGSYTVIDTFGNTPDVIVVLTGSEDNILFGPFTDGDSHYIVIQGPSMCESFVIASDAYNCQPTEYCEANTPYIELDFTGSQML